MGEIVNLEEYKQSKVLEEEYLKFLTYTNKFVGIPTSIPELMRAFYLILRYLEGTINCFETLSILKPMSEKDVSSLRQMVIEYLQGLQQELQKY